MCLFFQFYFCLYIKKKKKNSNRQTKNKTYNYNKYLPTQFYEIFKHYSNYRKQ